jgi:hypothetical protein
MGSSAQGRGKTTIGSIRLPRSGWRETLVAFLLAIAIGTASVDAAAQAPAGSTGSAASADSSGTAGSTSQPPAERSNDFPTLARVEFVLECLRDNPGARHEMVYKCVCAVDRVAEAVPYDRWVDLSTFFNAQPIAGERGAYIRERSDIQSHLKAYRDIQANAKKACFIAGGAK